MMEIKLVFCAGLSPFCMRTSLESFRKKQNPSQIWMKCWSRNCQRLHPFQERLAVLRQNKKEKNQCPNCGTTQEPITGSARELTNPENRSGQIITICPLCEYVYGMTF